MSSLSRHHRAYSRHHRKTSQQVNPPSNGMDDHNHITDGDFLHDFRDYTSVLAL